MTLKLKAINLENISQVNVAPSATNVNRSYGRRFTVSMGDSSKEVVLKDLFKKAEKLAKSASSTSELDDVNQFIAKLIEAETSAVQTYEERDDSIYKIRSWFHRVFGGAFLGTHLERLNNLSGDVDGKFVAGCKEYFKQNEPVLKSLVNQGFEIQVDGQIYAVEVVESNGLSLKIQKKENAGSDMGLIDINQNGRIFSEVQKKIDEHAIKAQEFQKSLTLLRALHGNNLFANQTINVNGKECQIDTLIDLTSGEGLEGAIYDAVIAKAYELSSSYDRGHVRIVRDGLKYIPEWHLAKICDQLESGQDFKIQFLAEDLKKGIGSDFGGLKRDYITTLAASLQASKSMFVAADGSLKLPSIESGTCNQKEAEIYQNLGRLFMACYRSQSNFDDTYDVGLISTGQFFSEALFEAAFALEKSDFAKSPPDEETYLKIALALLSTEPKLKACLELDVNQLLVGSEALNDAVAILSMAGLDYTDESGMLLDMEKINADPEKFIEDLRATILKQSNLVEGFNGASLGSMLDPVYQVASGMQNQAHDWSQIRTNPVEFSNKVQGSIDREKIVNSFKFTSFEQTVIDKGEWLKEWIKNDATDEELKAFLKFVTGTASLPEGSRIRIDGQAVAQPFPTASTCNIGFSISGQQSYRGWNKDMWDDTKEKFIANLKSAIAVEGFQRG